MGEDKPCPAGVQVPRQRGHLSKLQAHASPHTVVFTHNRYRNFRLAAGGALSCVTGIYISENDVIQPFEIPAPGICFAPSYDIFIP